MGWYTGTIRITSLSFTRVQIIAIESNAFNAAVFAHLQNLGIYSSLQIINYHSAMFNGLQQLFLLSLSDTHVRRTNQMQNFFQPLDKYLEQFLYTGCMGNGPVLTELFGRNELLRLNFINLSCRHESQLRLLAAQNFTGLLAVRFLIMTNCGIESIEIGAFDQICDTLEEINFNDNHLLKVNVDMFRTFLDKSLSNIEPLAKQFRFSSGVGHPHLNCTMEFYRLRNASLVSQLSAVFMICRNDIHVMDDSRQQIIHPQRWHLKHPVVYKYAVPKFQFHFDAAARTLRIMQSNFNHYRVLIWSINQRTSDGRCQLLQTNVKCHRKNRIIETIDIPEQSDSDQNLVAACVIHISLRKQSVPLHCVTMTMPTDEDFFHLGHLIGFLALLVLQFLFMFVFVAVLMKRSVAISDVGATNLDV